MQKQILSKYQEILILKQIKQIQILDHNGGSYKFHQRKQKVNLPTHLSILYIFLTLHNYINFSFNLDRIFSWNLKNYS